jgi:hypothetical protein
VSLVAPPRAACRVMVKTESKTAPAVLSGPTNPQNLEPEEPRRC